MSNTPQGAPKRKVRRSPYDLLKLLEAKREVAQARVDKLNAKIDKLRSKNESKIKVSELLATNSPEELEKELEALRTQQLLLRRALKSTHAGGSR